MNPTINDHPMKVVVVDETGQTINDHPLMVTPVGGGGGTPIAVQDEGSTVVGDLATLNFVGASVAVTDGGSGEAVVTITAGGGGGYTQKSQAVTDATPIEQDATFVYLASAATTIETGLVDGHVIVVANPAGTEATITGHINGADATPYTIPDGQIMTLFCALDMTDFGSPGVITWIAIGGASGGGGGAVTSVNGQTGDVNLTASNVGAVSDVNAGTGITVDDSGTVRTINNAGVTSFNGGTGAITFTAPVAWDAIVGTGETHTTLESAISSGAKTILLKKSGSPYSPPTTANRHVTVLQGESGDVELILNGPSSAQNQITVDTKGKISNLNITIQGNAGGVILADGATMENCTVTNQRPSGTFPYYPITMANNAKNVTIQNNVLIDNSVSSAEGFIRLGFYSGGDSTGKFVNNFLFFDGGSTSTIITSEAGWDIIGNTFTYTGAGAVTRDVISGAALDNLTNNVANGLTFASNFARIQSTAVIANNTILGFTTGLTIVGDNCVITGNVTDSDITIDASADKTLIATNNLGGGTLTDGGTNTLEVNNIA